MSAGAATFPPGFSEQVLASGLTRPMDVAWAPDGRMFVIQKDGLLRVVQPRVEPGNRDPRPISPIVNGSADRGLLGIAVDADFAANEFVYLLYTFDIDQGEVPESPREMVSQLMRVRITPQNQVVGRSRSSSEASRRSRAAMTSAPRPTNDVDCLPSEGTTHSIGSVRADPDGTLWVSNGDGFSPGELPPPVRTYDETSLSGKILHIDRDGTGTARATPSARRNDLTDVCTKVHSMGFRNPFRFTLRPGGGLVVGDVGWTQKGGDRPDPRRRRPELRLAVFRRKHRDAGLRECAAPCDPLPAMQTPPAYDYQHAATNAIVGGPTYTGSLYPAGYRNSIFFGDFTGGFIRRLVPNGVRRIQRAAVCDRLGRRRNRNRAER